jgi:hypothetical protein
MAQFEFSMTNKGAILLTKAIAGKQIRFTRCAVGDGVVPVDVGLNELSSLISLKQWLPISAASYKSEGKAVVRTTLTNKDVSDSFYIREIGLYAQDPDPAVGEILYAVLYAGANADLLPAYGGGEIVELVYDLIAVVGVDVTVTALIDDSIVYATARDLTDHVNDPMAHGGHNTDPNAHANLLALHLWRPTKVYEVGDICYSTVASSYKRFECVIAGTSGAAEPTWPALSALPPGR